MVAQKRYACTFCGQAQQEVQRLVVGPQGVYICDGCIRLCYDIVSPPAGRSTGAAPALEAELIAARGVVERLMQEIMDLRAAQDHAPTN